MMSCEEVAMIVYIQAFKKVYSSLNFSLVSVFREIVYSVFTIIHKNRDIIAFKISN